MSASTWYRGNADDDGTDTRGWILGHFIDPSAGERSTETLEVKWGVHKAGEQRADWVTGDKRTTLVLLVSGHFHVKFRDGDAPLTRQGDYLVWGPGTDHSWEAQEDSVVLTVRWPSLPQ
ncbi:hypothetical protein LY13_003993 [Prauserella aidingensis]|uniref:cupin domain-containing protein n=1 Tax=Prauserella aidingensis TaxID=387890 RepID=UPI0020A4EF85|nr:cupin domain-containing protein [Prauserella aidingensis]MCP2255219.1 hypothetical protein [Prauserella aidingensis]